jgi:hypothetical protein
VLQNTPFFPFLKAWTTKFFIDNQLFAFQNVEFTVLNKQPFPPPIIVNAQGTALPIKGKNPYR